MGAPSSSWATALEVLEHLLGGGFLLDAALSPQRLVRALAKMDGSIILDPDASRIARANVHLVPNPNVPTSECTGNAAPHRRAGRPLDRRAGHLGVRGPRHHRGLRRGPEASAREHPSAPGTARTRHCRPWSATATGSRRSRTTCPRSRSRTSFPAARRGSDPAAHRDRRAHRRGDPALRGRARHRRPAGPPPARGGAGRLGRRAPPRRARLPARRQSRGAHRRDGRALRARHGGAGRPEGGRRGAPPARGQPGPRPQRRAPRLPAAVAHPPPT